MIRKMHLLQLARGGGGEWGGEDNKKSVLFPRVRVD